MRHRHSTLRLRQKPAHARLLKRNLVTSLLLYETIRTTKKRAEVMQPIVDRIINRAKKNEPREAIRYVNLYVADKNACKKVMEVFIKRYANRTSGLTRMVPAGARKGDGAKLVDLMMIDSDIGLGTSFGSAQDKSDIGKDSKTKKPKSQFLRPKSSSKKSQ